MNLEQQHDLEFWQNHIARLYTQLLAKPNDHELLSRIERADIERSLCLEEDE